MHLVILYLDSHNCSKDPQCSRLQLPLNLPPFDLGTARSQIELNQENKVGCQAVRTLIR